MSLCAASDPSWVALAPFATPAAVIIAAAIAAIFAWRQARTARNKLRLDLFERRYVMYDATRELLFSWSANTSVPMEDLSKFLRGIKGTRWLYSEEFESYLMNDIFEPINRVRRLEDSSIWLQKGESEQNKIFKTSDKLQNHLARQLKEIDLHFSPYLQLEH